MTFSNLTFEQVVKIKERVKNFNNTRKRHRKNASALLDRDDMCGIELFQQGESGSYSVTISADFESSFEGRGNLQKGRYRLLGRMVRRGSREIDGKRQMSINTTGGHLPKKNGKAAFDIPDIEVFSSDSKDKDEGVLRRMSRNADFYKCDCCNRANFRDSLYVVENTEQPDKYAVLGTSCIDQVCNDKDFTKLMSDIDAIVNDKFDDKGRNARGHVEKWFLEPKKFMECVIVASELDLPSLVSPKKFDTYLSREAEAALSDNGKYHTFKKNTATQEIESVKAADSPLCAWAKVLYKSMYVYPDRVSPAIRALLDATNFEDRCNTVEVMSLASDALDTSELDKSLSDDDKLLINHSEDDASTDILWTLSAGEPIVTMLNKYLEESGRGPLYSEKISYRPATREENARFEAYGNQVYAVDLKTHGLEANRATLTSLLGSGKYTVPAKTHDGDIPVPAYTIKLHNKQGDKISDKCLCSYEFARGGSGYYRDNEGRYIFYSDGTPMFSMTAPVIHSIFGEQCTVERLNDMCNVLNDKGSISLDEDGRRVMDKIYDCWRGVNDGGIMNPICNKKYACSDGSDFTLYNISNTHCLAVRRRDENIEHARIIPLSFLPSYASTSVDYICDAVDKTKSMCDRAIDGLNNRVWQDKRNIDYRLNNIDWYEDSREHSDDLRKMYGHEQNIRDVEKQVNDVRHSFSELLHRGSDEQTKQERFRDVVQFKAYIRRTTKGCKYAFLSVDCNAIPSGECTLYGIEDHTVWVDGYPSGDGYFAMLEYSSEETIDVRYLNDDNKWIKKQLQADELGDILQGTNSASRLTVRTKRSEVQKEVDAQEGSQGVVQFKAYTKTARSGASYAILNVDREIVPTGVCMLYGIEDHTIRRTENGRRATLQYSPDQAIKLSYRDDNGNYVKVWLQADTLCSALDNKHHPERISSRLEQAEHRVLAYE